MILGVHCVCCMVLGVLCVFVHCVCCVVLGVLCVCALCVCCVVLYVCVGALVTVFPSHCWSCGN